MAEELVAEMVINGGLAANVIADQQMKVTIALTEELLA